MEKEEEEILSQHEFQMEISENILTGIQEQFELCLKTTLQLEAKVKFTENSLIILNIFYLFFSNFLIIFHYLLENS